PTTKTVSKANVAVREGRVVAKTAGPVVAFDGESSTEALKSRLAKLREEMTQTQSQYTERSPQIAELKTQIADLEKAINARSVGPLVTAYSAEYGARMEQTPAQADAIK